MKPDRRKSISFLTGAILISFASFAGSKIDEAMDRFKKGLMFVDEGDCKKAVVEFEESYKIYPTAAVLYNMALCYDDLHQYAPAMKYYQEFLATAKQVPKEQAAKIKERIEKLAQFLGTVSIKCNVAGALVVVDGTEMGKTPLEDFYLETGKHTISVTQEKYEEFSTTITLVSGRTIVVDANLVPVEEKKEELVAIPSRTVARTETKPVGKPTRKKLPLAAFYGTIAAAGALGIGAGVVGGLNIANYRQFQDTPYSETDKWKDLKDRGEILNVVFLSLIGATGAAMVAAAVIAAFTDFKKKKSGKEKPVRVSFAPGKGSGVLVLEFSFEG